MVAPSSLILVSRRSPLALQQSGWVKAELERIHPELSVEIFKLDTSGDRHRERPLPEIGGKGLFTKEMEDALLEGRADFAVHSLKDLPTEMPRDLVLAAVPRREDPRDVLVSRDGCKLSALRRDARIGTSSLRRAAQLLRFCATWQIEALRGNLDTRLRKLREGSLDGIVVAAAGLRRMGWEDQISEPIPETLLCPAAGQGALAIQARANDSLTLAHLRNLEDVGTRLAVSAERAMLRGLGGGCQVPIGSYAQQVGQELHLMGLVIRSDGSEYLKTVQQALVEDVNAAETLGTRAAEDLLRQGAARILESLSQASSPLPSPQAP